MTAKNVTWVDALALRDDLKQYGDNSVGLFALALRFGLDDIHSVAAESITDGSDDKKCDLIFIDREGGTAILAQCYSASKEKASAPANKASDLNTAIGWLLHSDINALPERIKSAAAELRKAIEDGFISRFEVWYIHNLPQSTNVQDELGVVEATAKSLIDRNYPKAQVSISALEVGRERLEEWYLETLSPILINDEISIDIDSGFSIQSGDWSAFVTAVPARSLYRLFKKYKAQLFSANVRDYLGSRKSDNNINHGIKTTVQSSPENFWAFNNGITVLTHDFRQETIKGRHQLIVKGLSIVNGAQRT